MDLRTQAKCECICVEKEESDKMREGEGWSSSSGREKNRDGRNELERQNIKNSDNERRYGVTAAESETQRRKLDVRKDAQ